jgi:hypothetical protein
MDTLDEKVELGAWIGKGQAFGLMSNKALAAQAQCLKQIRECNLHASLGMSWAEFCPRQLGISRSHADKLIHRLEEFGVDYFRLAELMRISPETYRAIESSVTNQHIRIDGELVPITPENGSRIRRALQAVRTELAQAKELRPTCTSITDLQLRIDSCLSLMRRLWRGSSDAGIRASLSGLINYTRKGLHEVAAEFEDSK